ncbi:hypothetical protein DL98DRAFT_568141 [Cadophora sp. DSE1049]|nr:hypothetical protein DL98DRAFT_568141 [Cadophora sp. DSE1049]
MSSWRQVLNPMVVGLHLNALNIFQKGSFSYKPSERTALSEAFDSDQGLMAEGRLGSSSFLEANDQPFSQLPLPAQGFSSGLGHQNLPPGPTSSCAKSGTGNLHQIFRMQVQRAKRTSKRVVSSTSCLIRSKLDNSKHFTAHPHQTSSWGRHERRVLYAHPVIGGEVIGSNQSLFRRFVRVVWTAELLHHSGSSSRSTFATTALQRSRASSIWARFPAWKTLFAFTPLTTVRDQSQSSEGSRLQWDFLENPQDSGGFAEEYFQTSNQMS